MAPLRMLSGGLILLVFFVGYTIDLPKGIDGYTSAYFSPGNNDRYSSQLVDLLSRVPVKSIREGLVWTEWDRSQPQEKIEKQRAQLKLLRAKVDSILFMGGYSNEKFSSSRFEWCQLNSGYGRLNPKQSLEFLATKWGRFLKSSPLQAGDYFQVLNEMNTLKYFECIGGSNLEAYARILKVSSDILRERGVKIVTGGVILEGNYKEWLGHLTSSEVYKSYDVLALHPYCYPKVLSSHSFDGLTLKQIVLWIRALWAKQGLESKPIWITEIGWPFHKGVESRPRLIQPAELKDRLQDLVLLKRDLDIERIYLYSLIDDEWYQEDSSNEYFGLFDKHFKYKLQ